MGLVRRSYDSRVESLDDKWVDLTTGEKRPSLRFTLARWRRQFLQSKGWMKVAAGFIGAWVALYIASTSGTSPPAVTITFGSQSRPSRDAFWDFKKDATCQFTSNDVHHSSGSPCKDRQSLLEAMSGGGRTGWDMPYWTRGCDMQWFTTAEICRILSRFDHIYILGDSLMRNLNLAMILLLRGDLSTGAKAEWLYNQGDEDHCTCRSPFIDHTCLPKSVIDTPTLVAGNPDSIKCPADKPMAHVTYHSVLSFPMAEQTFDWMANISNKAEPNGRTVFVLEHGFWNDLDSPSSMSWFEQVNDAIERYMPAYAESAVDQRLFPRLFISPQAQGEQKPEQFVATQNNLRLQILTKEMKAYVTSRGYEHLGLYNATVQATSTDGTHTTVEGNLLKAMFLLNWLNMIEPPDADAQRLGPPRLSLSEMAKQPYAS